MATLMVDSDLEIGCGTDPNDATSMPTDLDGDGTCDATASIRTVTVIWTLMKSWQVLTRSGCHVHAR